MSNPTFTAPFEAAADITLRLQRIVTGWRGAARGQPILDLHTECHNAVSPNNRYLVPLRLLSAKNLDSSKLNTLAAPHTRGQEVQFRVRPVGTFDSALVPIFSQWWNAT